MVVEPLLEHVVPFTLVLTRMGGAFMFAPIIGSGQVPVRAKALLAVAMASAVYAATPAFIQSPPVFSVWSLVPAVAMEAMIGLIIGTIATLPLVALEMAGHMMGYQMGLALARTFNPELGSQTEILGQVLFFLGVGLFMSLGGVEVMFASVARSFETVPLGGFSPGTTPLELTVGVLSSGFELALRIAVPVLCVVLLVLAAMGFIMKTMPQINVLSVGFAIKIVCGLFVTMIGVHVIADVAGDEIRGVLELIAGWTPGAGGG